MVWASACAGGGREAPSPPPKPVAAEPDLVRVPNVIGDRADEGAERIERAGLSVVFDPDPDDAELCRVEHQDESGEIDADTPVILSLACHVVVPNVLGEEAAVAQRRIEGRGDVTVAFDGEGSDAEPGCLVTMQDERGRVDVGTEVWLTLDCPITVEQVEEAARSSARKWAREIGGNYEVAECETVASDQGTCEARFFGSPDGIECYSTILVTDDGESTYSEETEKECE
jgi:sorbitol-specific phosphotransferase system component IIA